MKEFCPEKITRRCFLDNTVKLCFSIGLSSLFLDYGSKAEAAVDTGSGFEPAYLKLHKQVSLKSGQKNSGPLWKAASSVREDAELIVIKV